MSNIKLEVGKTYEVRDPQKVKSEGHHTTDKIVEDRGPDYHFRYKSENGDVYSENGHYYRSSQSDFYLVREVTP
jgi:hypothetical protein